VQLGLISELADSTDFALLILIDHATRYHGRRYPQQKVTESSNYFPFPSSFWQNRARSGCCVWLQLIDGVIRFRR